LPPGAERQKVLSCRFAERAVRPRFTTTWLLGVSRGVLKRYCLAAHTVKEKAAMTQAEQEAEIKSLGDQVSQLRRQQDGQRKHWFRWGLISGCIGIALSILSLIISLIAVAGPTPPICTILVFTALQLYVLCIAFCFAGKPPEGPIGSRLRWAWS
jgi:hypothetical protein